MIAAHPQLLCWVIIPLNPAAIFSIDLRACGCSQQTVLGAVNTNTEVTEPPAGTGAGTETRGPQRGHHREMGLFACQ